MALVILLLVNVLENYVLQVMMALVILLLVNVLENYVPWNISR